MAEIAALAVLPRKLVRNAPTESRLCLDREHVGAQGPRQHYLILLASYFSTCRLPPLSLTEVTYTVAFEEALALAASRTCSSLIGKAI